VCHIRILSDICALLFDTVMGLLFVHRPFQYSNLLLLLLFCLFFCLGENC